MSLVAYAASSSDEESENEDENKGTIVELLKPPVTVAETNGRPALVLPNTKPGIEKVATCGRPALALPKPKMSNEASVFVKEDEDEDVDAQVTPAFAKLPMPRTVPLKKTAIEEEDDEFLHKKAVPAAGSVTLEKPPAPPARARVKISIPSLREFADVDKERTTKPSTKDMRPNVPKGSGLLSILPQAKSERNFAKNQAAPPTTTTSEDAPRAKPAFVPDSVHQRRAAHNTESVDGIKAASKKQQNKTSKAKPLVNMSDSDDDDEDAATGDFFSLHSEQKLPEVNTNELSALVAKRAAKMVEVGNKYLEEVAEREAAVAERSRQEEEELRLAQKRYHEQQLDAEAMDALVGKNAKRRRKEAQEMQVIDISGSEVLPDRDEWMRTALASSTAFQPTGVLTDEEPAAGTRRKHQITYLAHKAKANEAELQAMWSANRQNRRATQSKYGF